MAHPLNYLWFQLGKLIFSLLEPIFHCWENWDTDVRRHLRKGLICLNEGNTAIALLNLNMVLSLKPNHFLALVSRGRLYLKEGLCQLAIQDLFKANHINAYRFSHCGLDSEYLRSLNNGMDHLSTSIFSNFSEISELLNKLDVEPEILGCSDAASSTKKRSTVEQRCRENNEYAPTFRQSTFSKLDHEKYDKLGPITQQEIDDTDWDQVLQDFTF